MRPWVLIGALAALGTVLGVALAGKVERRVGPFEATLSAVPALHGTTVIDLAPLGKIRLDTHDGPVRIGVRVDELRLDEARRLADDPALLEDVTPRIERDARRALAALLARAGLAGMAGAALLSLLWYRRPRPVLGAVATSLALTVVVVGIAGVTRHPRALAEPKYSGLLTLAPRAVGNVEDILDRFSEHRAELSALVANVSRLYQAGEALTPYTPDRHTIRLLHVSDVHLNPEAFDLMRQVVPAFRIDAVVDTGDINDWGSTFESPFADNVGDLRVPYVYVRGNHDSLGTQASVAAQPNAVVLDGRSATVAGLRFWGMGDPRYTPDKTRDSGVDEQHEVAAAFAATVADKARRDGSGIDVIAVHDPAIASEAGGIAPLVLSGHLHRSVERRVGSSLELVEGSTGGAGLRGLQKDKPVPLVASVLYVDPATHALRAYDEITVNGVVSGDVRIERHVVGDATAPAPAGGEETTTTTTATVP